MTGNPEEPKPANALRLKKGAGGAADGADKCVSCGAPLAADAVVCVRCGFDKRSARHIRTEQVVRSKPKHENHGGFLWSVLVFLFWIALLAGLGYGLYEGYGYYERNGAKGMPWSHPAPKRHGTVPCTQCKGTGKIKCPVCGGFGTVDTVIRSKCTQCGGTGKYTLMSKRDSASCPFCRGQGFTEKPGRENCKDCGARGWVNCPVCGGRGKIVQ